MTLQDTHKKLRKRRLQNILLNFLCILIAGSGLIWVANYFWKYIHYEITNDAFIDQYVSPLNIRASGYIKEVRFKEHQYVHQGDTLLILDNREYQIKVKEAEAARRPGFDLPALPGFSVYRGTLYPPDSGTESHIRFYGQLEL